jgi:FkbM family methyltransferase
VISALLRAIRGGPATPAPLSLVFDPKASAADIEACFRLILGRNPNPEERAGHFSRVGENLSDVVASFITSLEFSRRGLAAPSSSMPIEVARDGFVMFAMPDDLAVGQAVLAGNYEPDVTACIKRFLSPGMGVIDLGANIGTMSLLAASIVGPLGFVLAIEPNSRNARLLEMSRRRNGFQNLTVCQSAAGPDLGLLVLHPSFSNGTTSECPDDLLASPDVQTVPAIPPQSLLRPGQRVDLIKADVEGAEYLALRGCLDVLKRDRPMIVSEFSPSLLAGISGIDGPTYLAWLQSLDYRLSVIEPNGGLSMPLSPGGVMDAYRARGTDHIDIAATPRIDAIEG